MSLSNTQIYTHVSIGKRCQVHQQTHAAQDAQRSTAPTCEPLAGSGEARDAADTSRLDGEHDTPSSSSPRSSSSDSSEPSADAATAGGQQSHSRPADEAISGDAGDDDQGSSQDDDDDSLFWTITV